MNNYLTDKEIKDKLMAKILNIEEFFTLDENKESCHLIEVSVLTILSASSIVKYTAYLVNEIKKRDIVINKTLMALK